MKARLFFIAMIAIIGFSANAQWQFAGLAGKSIMCLTARGNTVFAGTWGEGVFYSNNIDTNWVAVDSGLTSSYIIIMATCGTNVFAGTDNGVFLLSGNDSTWVAVDSGLQSNVVISAMTVYGNNIYAGRNQVYLSANNGTSWTPASPDKFDYLNALATNGSDLFAASEWESGQGELFGTLKKSAGDSVFTQIFNFPASTIAASDSNVFVGFNDSIFKSNDDGATWIKETIDSIEVNSIVINDTNIFAGGETGYGITSNPKVFLSSIHDTSWTDISYGLPNGQFIRTLVIKGDTLFAVVGDSGVWKLALTDIKLGVKEINNNTGNIAVYPNPASEEIKVIGNQCSVNGIEIYNSLGEKVYQFVNSHSSLGILPMTNAPITINIADFPNGVYLVKLITANGAEVRKFVKE
jgi:hypothetical protein